MSHVVARCLANPDRAAHPAEADLVQMFREAGTDEVTVVKARAAGISWPALLQLILEYGPKFIEVLKLILAALKDSQSEPDLPPAAPRKHRRKEKAEGTAPESTEPKPE